MSPDDSASLRAIHRLVNGMAEDLDRATQDRERTLDRLRRNLGATDVDSIRSRLLTVADHLSKITGLAHDKADPIAALEFQAANLPGAKPEERPIRVGDCVRQGSGPLREVLALRGHLACLSEGSDGMRVFDLRHWHFERVGS